MRGHAVYAIITRYLNLRADMLQRAHAFGNVGNLALGDMMQDMGAHLRAEIGDWTAEEYEALQELAGISASTIRQEKLRYESRSE